MPRRCAPHSISKFQSLTDSRTTKNTEMPIVNTPPHLRNLAQQHPNALPPEVDAGKQILNSLETQSVPSQEEANLVIRCAESDTRVKIVLAGQRAVHAYPTFQGFAWVVRFSNHSRGTLAIAIVDAKTLKVLDVCMPSSGGSDL